MLLRDSNLRLINIPRKYKDSDYARKVFEAYDVNTAVVEEDRHTLYDMSHPSEKGI